MQYNLVHRGAVIKTFDTNEMDPDEVREITSLKGRYFRLERTQPDQLPPMPDGYDNLASVPDELARSTGGFRTGRLSQQYQSR